MPRGRPGRSDVRYVRGYDETDPRPPLARTLDARARGGARLRARRPRALARHAGLRPHGRRADDVHEAPGSTRGPDAADATPLLAAARAIKTDAGDRADPARERDLRRGDGARPRRAPARHEGERGGGDLAGVRPRRGHGLARARSSSRSASRSSGRARGSRRSPRPATGRSRPTSRRCSRSGSAPTATGATTRSSSAPASCAPTTASSRRRCSRSTRSAIDHCRPGASLAELDRLVRDGHRRGRLPGPADASDLPRRRRARPRAAVRPPGGRRRRSRRAWCSRSSRAATGRAAAACASRTTS